MRLLLCAAVCWNAAGLAILAEVESFPYLAYVAQENVALRCGPGEEFYATDFVARGEQVEVYQRSANGWLAIRPPQRAFSWLAADQVQRTEQSHIGVVSGNEAISWVGTRLSQSANHQWQVKLKAGEQVALQGERELPIVQGVSPALYYKIAPPSGEFRWLESQAVMRLEPAGPSDSAPAVQLVDHQEPVAGSHRAAAPAATANVTGTAAEQYHVNNQSASGRPAWIARATAPASPRPSSSWSLDTDVAVTQELQGIDLELSRLIVTPTDTWDLAPLRQRTEALVDRARSALDRGRARLMIDKIDEIQDIQDRQRLVARRTLPGLPSPSAQPATTGANENVAAASSLVSAEAPALPAPHDATGSPPQSTAEAPQFDGRGWLLPVHAKRPSTPPFALLDRDGNVVSYVTPAPGLNLHRYLRKEIGVFGQRSYLSQYESSHITAQRIVDISRHKELR